MIELVGSGDEGVGLLLKPPEEKVRKTEDVYPEVSFPSTSSVSLSINAEGVLPGYGSAETYGRQFSLAKRGKKVVDIVIPELENINVSNPVLTSRIRPLVHIFWSIVTSKAMQAQLPISKTTVSIISFPDEEQKKVGLKLFTEANASQAIAFWESLDSEIGEWVAGMNEADRLLFIKTISLRIHWESHEE